MEDNKQTAKETNTTTQKKKSILERVLRVIMYIALTIVGLNVLLYILLSIPAIQNKLTGLATDQLKKTLNTEVSIDEIRLSLFNHVTVKGVYLEDQNKDTLVYAGYLDVKLSPWKLLNNKLQIDNIKFDDFTVKANQKDSVSNFNFQFIIDAFASNDTTQTDTTSSSLVIVIENLDIRNGNLRYDVLSAPESPGLFNASHILISDLGANLNLKSIDPDKLDIALNTLAFKEKSGLELTQLNTHLFSEDSIYKVDGLTLKLSDSHFVFEQAEYNKSNDEFKIKTKSVQISPFDIAHILPEAKNLNDNLSLSLDLEGKLPLINAHNIELALGKEVILKGNAFIANYEDYGNTNIKINIQDLTATSLGITSLARLGDSTFVAPDILKTLGNISLTAKLDGALKDFNLNANMRVNQGQLVAFVNGGVDTTFTNIDLQSHIETQNFNLGNLLLSDPLFGKLSVYMDARVHQSANYPMSVTADGAINLIQYQNQDLRNIAYTAFYNNKEMGLSLDADLPQGKILAHAKISQSKVPDVHLDLDVENLRINDFYKNNTWHDPKLSFKLNGDTKGLDIDNMTGSLSIDNLRLQDTSFDFKPGKFIVDLGLTDDHSKYIRLNSSIVSANISGNYTFATLPDEFNNLMNNYLSNVFSKQSKIRKYQNNFDFAFNLKNTEQLGKIFQIPVDVITPLTISGTINTIDRKIKIDGDFPLLRYGDIDIKNTKLNISNLDSAFNVNMAADVNTINGDYALSLKINGSDNSIHTYTAISSRNSGNNDININGNLETIAQFTKTDNNRLQTQFQVHSTDIAIGNLVLNILPAKIVNRGDWTSINNFGLGLNKRKFFGAEGVISKQRTDSLKVYFNQAQIGDILSAFEIHNIKANINGNIVLTNMINNIELYTKDLTVKDIIIFSDTLGTMKLSSLYSESLKGAQIDALIRKEQNQLAHIKGMIYTASDSLDLKVNFNRFPLQWIEPFMAGTLNKLSGSISSGLNVKGKISSPIVSGFLGFNQTSIGIDYTNVTYTISDTINISPDKIGFDNLTLRDNEGNKAIVNALVTHRNFENMKYSLNIGLDKLMVLNTQSRTDSLFYGKIFTSGAINLEGDDNGIRLNAKIKNDKRSTINILVPQTSQASKYQSVVYINVPEDKKEDAPAKVATSTVSMPINIGANIELTPDITLAVIIDPSTGDAMHVKGSGLINFTYDMTTDNMNVFGDYTISEGAVRISLQGLKKLEFNIKDGSKLSFVGDPLKTKFNIKAYRRVKADLTTLDQSFASEDYSPKVNVDCVLGISGDMDKMDLTYDVELPDANDDIQRKVRSIINTDEQKITQFAYLIATNSFHSNTVVNAGGNVWASAASGALSSVLNSVFGNLLGDKWEIGTNIESSDGSFSDVDMSVDVSTRVFNDKLKLHTNVGYNQSATTEASFVGDFDAEYQLSKNWTIKAYNKTNDRYYKQAATTQGIGVAYTKEARTLKLLFRSFKRKRHSQNANNNVTNTRTQKQEDKQTNPIEGGK